MPMSPRSTGQRERALKPVRAKRLSPTARGYGEDWVQFSARFIEEQFAAGNVNCAMCGKMLSGVRSEIHVDHIHGHKGPGDPMRLEPTNLQLLHVACHSRKTMLTRGGQ